MTMKEPLFASVAVFIFNHLKRQNTKMLHSCDWLAEKANGVQIILRRQGSLIIPCTMD